VLLVTTPAVPLQLVAPDSNPLLRISCVDAVVLLTLKLTELEVPTLPAASVALATSAWLPLASVVESSVIEYGAVVSVPFAAPST